ncbi:MAG: Na+/H+ antiporter NhaC family protein, partial [Odoribacter sp.]|nr:Na+/H+ antiporter NhaC family protein [Odoribacter sp.]
FYKSPITVAFIIASAVAILITTGKTFNERITHFSQGAADKNILLMIWIFILAGAFARSAEAMGAIDATVNFTLKILPDNLLLAGIFIAACFISLSVGTSVGTIVALVPVAVGIADKTGVSLPFITAVVVGGAFFGDNLSFISDTTIAATRTQGCKMKDKFTVNSLIVMPAAIVVLIYYVIQGLSVHSPMEIPSVEWVKMIPYLIVLILAIAGMNVMIILMLGICLMGIIGKATGGFEFFGYFEAMGKGITGMGELIIVTLLAGGLLEMIRINGGMDYIMRIFTRNVNSKRRGELSIAGLVSLTNLCTANNTIAIITTGPIARDIASRFEIDKRKSASILDTFSCFIQGIIPYGAQLLIASELSGLSPLSIIGYLYYPFLTGILGLLAILLRYPKKYS